jgi:hypothetical protein
MIASPDGASGKVSRADVSGIEMNQSNIYEIGNNEVQSPSFNIAEARNFVYSDLFKYYNQGTPGPGAY